MASESSELESRIAAIEHRAAIADLIHRYAEAIRDCSLDGCLALLAHDAFIELRQAHPHVPGASEFLRRFEGREQILASFGVTAGQGARIWPMIHNLRIELDGNEARSNCVMMSAIWPHGKQYVGEYKDTFRIVEGEWKFTSRTYSVFGDTDGRYSKDSHADYVAAKGAIGDA